jgi:hypothetical protein
MSALPPASKGSGPWWKFPLVWLVLGLPAVVVVGSLTSAWIAISTADPVVEENYYQKGLEINQMLAGKSAGPVADKALVPAEKGRNHSTTPVQDMPSPPPPLPR